MTVRATLLEYLLGEEYGVLHKLSSIYFLEYFSEIEIYYFQKEKKGKVLSPFYIQENWSSVRSGCLKSHGWLGAEPKIDFLTRWFFKTGTLQQIHQKCLLQRKRRVLLNALYWNESWEIVPGPSQIISEHASHVKSLRRAWEDTKMRHCLKGACRMHSRDWTSPQ